MLEENLLVLGALILQSLVNKKIKTGLVNQSGFYLKALHGFCAVCHLIAEIVRIFVDGEDRAEIEEEAQTPGHGAD